MRSVLDQLVALALERDQRELEALRNDPDITPAGKRIFFEALAQEMAARGRRRGLRVVRTRQRQNVSREMSEAE